MKYTIQKLFQQLGLKQSYNAPSKKTAVGQYAYLMFDNVSHPKITDEQACEWVLKHKKDIRERIFETKNAPSET